MTQVFTFESRSGGKPHTVKVLNGKPVCSCRGYDTPNRCWHVKDVATRLGLNCVIGNELFGHVSEQPNLVQNVTMPVPAGFIEPMLASPLKEGRSITDYQVDGWHLEIKYDGHRMIVVVTEDREVTFYARGGLVRPHAKLADYLPQLCAQLAPGTYDGELFVPGGTSTDVTAEVYRSRLRLVLFDILKVGPHSAMDRPSDERHALLEEATSRLNCQEERLTVAPRYPVTAAGLQSIFDNGGEGAIIKRTKAAYRPGYRTQDWVKFKKKGSAEIRITGFLPGRLGDQSRIVGVDRDGTEVRVKAKNDEWRRLFGDNPNAFIDRILVIEFLGKKEGGRYTQPRADHIK